MVPGSIICTTIIMNYYVVHNIMVVARPDMGPMHDCLFDKNIVATLESDSSVASFQVVKIRPQQLLSTTHMQCRSWAVLIQLPSMIL